MFELGRLILIGTACFAVLLSGCEGPSRGLSTEYGKINGIEGSFSINGTSVFHDMFVERGFKVRSTRRISPKIDRYETLVWFPDDYSCPSPKAIEAIEQWLSNGWDRTFIYVGRDYNAQGDYLADVLGDAPPGKQEELLRQMAEANLERDTVSWNYYRWKEDLASCDWFERSEEPRRRTTDLSGAFARGLTNKGSVEVSDLLKPVRSDPENVLLKADGEPVVFKVDSRTSYADDGQIVVVSNGSFLVNYALVDQDNRRLASKLIDQCSNGDVLFLESGAEGIRVSDSDTVNHNSWAWVAEPPLRYIVPHFLIWGIVFCFVFFPIFGRPRESQKKSTSTFRNHVTALGKMVSRTDLPNRAINKIRKYQEMVGETKRKKD